MSDRRSGIRRVLTPSSGINNKYNQPTRQAVILAAGMGSRLGDHKNGKPKAFLKIGNETLIERSCRILFEHGVKEIIVGTGYMHSYFIKWARFSDKIECIKNEEYSSSGSFLTLINCINNLDEEFLLLEADLLYEPKAIEAIINSESSSILTSSFTQSGDEVYVSINDENELLNLSKDKSTLESADAELVGINKLSLVDLKFICNNLEEEELKSINYEIAFARFAKELKPKVKKLDDLIWCEIDSPEHLDRAVGQVYPAIVRSTE